MQTVPRRHRRRRPSMWARAPRRLPPPPQGAPSPSPVARPVPRCPSPAPSNHADRAPPRVRLNRVRGLARSRRAPRAARAPPVRRPPPAPRPVRAPAPRSRAAIAPADPLPVLVGRRPVVAWTARLPAPRSRAPRGRGRQPRAHAPAAPPRPAPCRVVVAIPVRATTPSRRARAWVPSSVAHARTATAAPADVRAHRRVRETRTACRVPAAPQACPAPTRR